MFRWRLHYADGRMCEERLAGSTILEAWPHAIRLEALDSDGWVIAGVNLRPGMRPVWYRKRSFGLNVGQIDVQTDATVFGSAWESADTVHSKLWAIEPHGGIVDCPPRWIDQTAIQRMITRE